ncbi:MAG: hypothetical protein IH965_06000 [Gemmatimonadetes bacterium]|nr:hypothetical protein [Gemmatimonadota bacterium]
MADRRRRGLGGWGFEAECYAASAGFVAWLEERLENPLLRAREEAGFADALRAWSPEGVE